MEVGGKRVCAYVPERFKHIWDRFRRNVDRNTVALAQNVGDEGSRPVYGSGNEYAEVLLLGEAPGRDEATHGLPFVGKSGALLQEHILDYMNLDREKDMFVTNIMNIRPYTQVEHTDWNATKRYDRNGKALPPPEYFSKRDRPPRAKEIASHVPYLVDLLQEMRPKIVFCFGRVASTIGRADFDVDHALGFDVEKAEDDEEVPYIGIKREQGEVKPVIVPGLDHMVWLVPMLHPSYFLRIRDEKKRTWEVRSWQRAFKKAWDEYRHKALLETPAPILLRDIRADLVRETIAASSDPVEAARRFAWSGATVEEEWPWTDPHSVFYRRPDSQTRLSIEEAKSYAFECTDMQYNRFENCYELTGNSNSADSVYCRVEGFRFHFYSDVPNAYRQVLARQKCFREGSPMPREDLLDDHEAMLMLQQEDYDHRDAKEALGLLTRRLRDYLVKETSMDREQAAGVQLEIVQNDSLYGYRNRDYPPTYHMKVWFSVFWQMSSCRKAITALWEELTQFYEVDFKADSRFTYDTRIKACSWIELPRGNFTVDHVRGTRTVLECQETMRTRCDVELRVNVADIIPHDPSEKGWNKHAPKLVASLDIECARALSGGDVVEDPITEAAESEEDRRARVKRNARNKHRFPKPHRSAIIDICVNLQKQDENTRFDKKGVCKRNKRYVFTLRKCSPVEGAQTNTFLSEIDMLVAFFVFLSQADPDVVVGHNVKRFDLWFILKRLELLRVLARDGLLPLGRIYGTPSAVVERRFQSRAFGTRVVLNFVSPGTIIVDTLEIYFREKKMPSYKLQAIAEQEIGDAKNDMPYVAIAGFFWGDADQNCEESTYCDKDAQLPNQLLNKGKWLYNMWEFARINGSVFPNGIYVRGQQIKVVSAMMHQLRQYLDHAPQFILPTQKERPMFYEDGEQVSGEDVNDKEVATYDIQGMEDALMAIDNPNNIAADEEDDGEGDGEGEGAVPLNRRERRRRERCEKKLKKKMTRPHLVTKTRREFQSAINAFFNVAVKAVGREDDEEYKEAVREEVRKRTSHMRVAEDDELFDSRNKLAKSFANTAAVKKKQASRDKAKAEKLKRDLKNITYKGATVLPAVLGLHIAAVLCADFASLYPSIMIRYNVSHELKVFRRDLAAAGLTLADVFCSPVKGFHPSVKEVPGFEDLEDKASLMEEVYFVRQEYIRSLFGSHLDRRDICKKILQFDRLATVGTEIRVGDTKDAHVIPVPLGPFESAEEEAALRKPIDALMEGYWEWAQARYAPGTADGERARREGLFFVREEMFGMGVMPRTLVTLLNARKAAKREMAKSAPGSVQHSIWNGTQLALKILANSLYGATGVEFGQIADQDLGAAVTAWGRVAIELAKEEAEKKWKKPNTAFTRGCNVEETKCVGGDSVTEDTPVLVRHAGTGEVRILRVDQLVDEGQEWGSYGSGKEQAPAGQWQAWTHKGWGNIRRVIRHRTTKRICRVNTWSGIVDVTEDHSLIRDDETVVKPSEIYEQARSSPHSNLSLLHAYPSAQELCNPNAPEPTDEQIVDAYRAGKELPGACQRSPYDAEAERRDNPGTASSIQDDPLGNEWPSVDQDIVYGHRSLRRAFVLGLAGCGFSRVSPRSGISRLFCIREEEDLQATIADYVRRDDLDLPVTHRKISPGCKSLAADLYFIFKSLNLAVGIEYDLDTYAQRRWREGGVELHFASSTIFEVSNANSIRSIQDLWKPPDEEERTVYDLEVDIQAVEGGGVFQAGIGSLIVHNTDSFFQQFCFAKTIEEGMEFGARLVHYLNKFYRLPMKLVFEKVMWPMLVIAKKRYTGNLFAGEDNWDFFDKKRWVELHLAEELWEEIFKGRERLTETYTPEAWAAEAAKYPEEDVLSAEEFTDRDVDYDWEGREIVTEQPMVRVTRLGGVGWWKNGQWKTKEEWYGGGSANATGILPTEEARRMAQSDEEWMADFLRPRYAGLEYNPADQGKMFGKGIETVRRDSVPITRDIMTTTLRMALIEGRLVDSLVYVYGKSKDVLEGRVSEIDLICSKAVTKEHYKSHTLPHTNLIKRMEARGDPAPGLGDRVPFLIVKGHAGQKMYERAEHPDYVIAHDLPIDYEYYVTNKITKPLNRIVQYFMQNSVRHLFTVPNITDQRRRATLNETSACRLFAHKTIKCVKCGEADAYASTLYGVICPRCLRHSGGKELDRIVGEKRKRSREASEEYRTHMAVCIECTNVQTAPCNNFGCNRTPNQYFKRRKAEREMERCAKELVDIESLVGKRKRPEAVGVVVKRVKR